MIRVLTVNERKEGQTDLVAHKSDRSVVCSCGEEAETHLDHRLRTGAVDEGIDIALARALLSSSRTSSINLSFVLMT